MIASISANVGSMPDEQMTGKFSMTEDLLFETRDGIGFITFNRPAQRNALTFQMYEELATICDDPGDVRALVISGAGGAFAAGTDMSQFRAFDKPEDALNYEHTMDAVMTRIERCPVPTIAAITGACTGGGAAIAACCDLRITDEKLKFGFPIARTLGNCLSVASLARLSALIGQAKVREIIYSGAWSSRSTGACATSPSTWSPGSSGPAPASSSAAVPHRQVPPARSSAFSGPPLPSCSGAVIAFPRPIARDGPRGRKYSL